MHKTNYIELMEGWANGVHDIWRPLQGMARGVAAYTLSRHGVHIGRLKKKEMKFKKNILLLKSV
jgi:hypothetical protein